MKLLIQRVKEAKVTVEGELTGQIGHGLLVFFGVKKGDTEKEIPWLVSKLVGLRIFRDEQDKMNLSVQDVEGEVLIVSQFTLYGDCTEGRRPSFTESASGPNARRLYDEFVQQVKQKMGSVQTGRFAAPMEVSLINDGPVTFIVEKN